VAFVPQFLNPAAPLIPQFAILIGSFVSLAAVNALVYALPGGHAWRATGWRGPRSWRGWCGPGARRWWGWGS
jgi:threonine/homoserine/homoserine lactone efflux protein